MEKIEYKNITASVRSAKVAVLVYSKDEYWRASILNIIQWFSQVWGGMYNIIIPTDGKTIDEKHWKVLEKFNPDYIYHYHPTQHDLRVDSPKKYEELIKKWKAELKKKFPHMNSGEIKKFINDQVLLRGRYHFEIAEELQEELKQRLAPFYFDKHVATDFISANSAPNFPLTNMLEIMEHTDKFSEIYSINTDCSLDIKLFYSSVIGGMSEKYKKGLREKKVKVTEIEIKPAGLNDFLNDAAKGNVDLGLRAVRASLGVKKKTSWNPDENFFRHTPFSLSMLKLGLYHRLDDDERMRDSAVIILGDTVDDFCLYYSLSRMKKNIYWISKGALVGYVGAVNARKNITKKARKVKQEESMVPIIVNTAFEKIGFGHNNSGHIYLASASLTEDELNKDKEQLARACYFESQEFSNCLIVIGKTQDLLKGTWYVYEENNFTTQFTESFINNESVGYINTPKPKNFSFIKPYEHRWITELSITGYKLPRLHFLGTKVVKLKSSAKEARVSENGISYFCPNFGYFGGDVDVILVKPKLQIIEPIEIVSQYLEEAGFKNIKLSDKGSFMQEAINKFGSLEELGEFLCQEKNRKLLDKFRKDSTVGKDRSGDGEIVRIGGKDNGRNYLDFEAIKSANGSNEEAVKLIDNFIAKKILYRGFIFQCKKCRNSDWYNIKDVSESFECKRCGSIQVYQQENWKDPHEPKWYYKLDEPIYLGYENNMHVPVLTLRRLKKDSKGSFLFTPEIEFENENGEKIELDIFCVVDGMLNFGECKINSEIFRKKTIEKYSSVLSKLKKQPDGLVFSSFADKISDEQKEKLTSVFDCVSIFSKVDLCN